MTFVGADQVLYPVEKVYLETVEVPFGVSPSLHDGGHHREGVPPEKEVLPLRERGQDLIRDQVVAWGLVQEVAGAVRGSFIVEAEGKLADLRDVILPSARQHLVEVLDRRDQGPVIVFGVDSILSEGVKIGQQDPGL